MIASPGSPEREAADYESSCVRLTLMEVALSLYAVVPLSPILSVTLLSEYSGAPDRRNAFAA